MSRYDNQVDEGREIDSLAIPNTVQAVLADRIDRLPIAEKQLLQTAAVIGVNLPLRLLRTVTELPEEQLQQCLSHLQSAEFLYESSLFPELEYAFKHALTNGVVYGALLHDRRTFLHAKIVKALEEIGKIASHDQLEKLAHHSLRGELWDKAVHYLSDAGAMAASRSSFRNAAHFVEQALDALRYLPESRDSW